MQVNRDLVVYTYERGKWEDIFKKSAAAQNCTAILCGPGKIQRIFAGLNRDLGVYTCGGGDE